MKTLLGQGNVNCYRPGVAKILLGRVDVDLLQNRLCSVQSLAVLILSVLPAASYIYTKLSSKKHTSSPSLNSVLPQPSIAFQTTPSTILQISTRSLICESSGNIPDASYRLLIYVIALTSILSKKLAKQNLPLSSLLV